MRDLGKAFEQTFRRDWINSFPGSLCLRLPDQQSGYAGTSQNPCDFICYNYPTLYLLELKSHKGNTFPFTCLHQYYKLVNYTNINGLEVSVIIWFRDHDKILYIPISEITKMMRDGKKSVNIKMLKDKAYNIIEIPNLKKRTFLVGDYTVLVNKKD